ncbi:branched-chain amino acid ABC transporter permease [Bosea sp. TND4EK4]|uniref:branched-chain amino acid ABC transporter permease n=1 Tax=Bosea sp. TND4EK4 TaxID=1907408 RepID=UPI0009563465|nr:branched-chain amino acid ABC transporter permease [Bosea sp. TND4EK4]SIR46067.1 amino acid/amide ABC transporter membrane protein 1, HAAT family [Bosea sp. TND4EK4]
MALFQTVLGVLLHGLAYAMVLYLISVGLSVTMGLLGIANLAHGIFAMAGGYLTMTLLSAQGWSLPLALAVSFLGIATLGAIMERLLYARLHGASELDQVLFSIGLIFIGTAAFQYVFGPLAIRVSLPAALRGAISFGEFSFPTYRALLIVSGVAVFAALWLSIEHTLIGARVRATVENPTMAKTLGVNTRLLYTGVFALGSGLAALGGSLGAELIPLFPNYASVHLASFLIVVAVGGLGTIKGPFFAAILLGVADTACKLIAPDMAAFFTYAAVFAILTVKPNGLFGIAK